MGLASKVLLIWLFLCSAWAKKLSPSEVKLRDQLLGNILKSRLEMMHYSHKLVDDELSEKAFKMMLDRLDQGKQYLLAEDIRSLEKYRKKIDDSMLSGDFGFLKDVKRVFNKRLENIKGIVQELKKKKFNYKKKEFLESDYEKRKYLNSMDELKELWRKIVKYSIMGHYFTLEEENKEAKKKKTEDKLWEEAKKKTFENFDRIFKRMKQEDHDDELEQFFNAVTMVFDPHTNYFPPQKKEDFDIEMRGTLEGIGAMLKEDGAYIKVVRIIPGSASWRQGDLGPEDTILKVAQANDEPVDIVNMRISDAVQLIRGKKGTTVKLTVKKPNGKIMVIPIVRDIVQIEDAYAKGAIIDFKGHKEKYGYIYLPKFYRDFEAQVSGGEGRNCTDDVRKLLEEFAKEKVSGVILDLRNNGGGALEDARLMSGLFIEKGPIVQIKQSNGQKDILWDEDESISYKGHVIVLLNRFSASASEILAGALQDYSRAVIIGGDHSHGKGTVQVFLNLDRGLTSLAKKFTPFGALKITIQKFYRVTGGSTQYKGITPDIVLPDPYSYMESGEKYLDYSLEWDEVEPLKFKRWRETKLDLPNVIKNSKKRVGKSPKFKKLSENIKILQQRKDETKLSLNFVEAKKHQDELSKDSDRLKIDDVNKSITIVKTLGENKKEAEALRKAKGKGVRKKSVKEETKRKAEWVDNLKKDPYIEESIYVLKDLVKVNT